MCRIAKPPRTRSRSLRRGASLLGVLAAATLAAPEGTQAQDVRFKTVTNTEWAGVMGSAMRMAGEDTGPDTTTTWIKGLQRREDQGNHKASWILDLETMDMTRWDHEDESYWTMNFPAYIQSADSSVAEAQAEMTDEDRAQMNAIEPSMQVDRTGEIRTINGWEAERVIITMTLAAAQEMAETPEDDPMAAMMGQSSMVMISDLWISDDLPGYDQMREALGDESQDFASGSGGMQSLAAANPRMAAMAEELQEEMQGLEGEAVRSTVYNVMVPTGVELEVDSILAMSDEPLPEGPDFSTLMAEAMADAAKDEGEDAATGAVTRALGGRLGGLLNRGRDAAEEAQEDTAQVQMQMSAPAPTVMMRIVTEIIDVEQTTLSEADFQPPARYREIPRPGG